METIHEELVDESELRLRAWSWNHLVTRPLSLGPVREAGRRRFYRLPKRSEHLLGWEARVQAEVIICDAEPIDDETALGGEQRSLV